MIVWPVRQTSRNDWNDIKTFFKNLDRTSRYYYYGFHANDENIDKIWTEFEQRNDSTFFVVENLQGIIGVCQVVRYADTQAEIAVIVRPEYRKQNIAQSLVERAVLWCKTHSIDNLMMYCLPENNVIMKIIRKNNLLPLSLSHPDEAKFDVPGPEPVDLQRESVVEYTSAWMTLSKNLLSRWVPKASLDR